MGVNFKAEFKNADVLMTLKLYEMKKILIALDQNAGAEKIAKAGYELSGALHAHTILLHVGSDSTSCSPSSSRALSGFDSFNNVDKVQPDMIQALKRTARDYLDTVRRNLGDETIEPVVKEGDYAENILQTAKEINADIIVMGTQSRKGLDKVLLGSVTDNVLHRTTIPLFIIPVRCPE